MHVMTTETLDPNELWKKSMWQNNNKNTRSNREITISQSSYLTEIFNLFNDMLFYEEDHFLSEPKLMDRKILQYQRWIDWKWMWKLQLWMVIHLAMGHFLFTMYVDLTSLMRFPIATELELELGLLIKVLAF